MKNPRFYYLMTLIGYFGLLTLLLLWNTVLLPSTQFPTAPILAIVLVPLLFPLRGILHARPYACAWAAFLSMLYFVHGVLGAFSSGLELILASIEILFSLMVFFGCAFFIRFNADKIEGE